MMIPTWWRLSIVAATLYAGANSSTKAATGDWAEAQTILSKISDPKIPAAQIDITTLGAVADGKTDSLPAIRKAIIQLSAAGGGHVIVPAGTYFVNGPIKLESNIDLHLNAGSVLFFGPEPAPYLPVVLSRYEGTMYYGYSARITAKGATNVAITGNGMIDGNARGTFALMKGKSVGSGGELRKDGADQVPIENRVFGEGKWLRPSFIEPVDCKNVLVEGVTLKDSTFWVVHPLFCENVTVRNVMVDSMNANNDGCDPDSSSDVLIEGCDFHTGDDSIAIKSGRDKDGRVVGRPTERIVIRHCLMRSRYSALCIGSEMSGDVRDIFMEDCKVTGSASAFYFKGNIDRGGIVEHVRARNITVDSVRESAIRFETSYHGNEGGHTPPTFRDFTIEDLACKNSDAYAVYVEGLDGVPIRDVTLRHITVDTAKAALWLKKAVNVRFEDVRVNSILFPLVPPDTDPSEKKLAVKN